MKTVSEIVRLGPVIPVLAFDSVEQGENVSRALHAGGVKVLEITLRTAAGLEAIERASHLAEDIVVGVGTITKPEHCAQAKKAGAQFGVSPGLTKEIHQAALDCGLPLLPGVMTPTDIIQAMELGYEIVKLFPAQQAGGVSMLQALNGPFPSVAALKAGGTHSETLVASSLRVSDRTSVSPVSTIALPADVAAGWYNLVITIKAAGGNTGSATVIQVTHAS